MLKIILIGLFVWVLIEIADFFKSGAYGHTIAFILFKIICVITAILGIFVFRFVKTERRRRRKEEEEEKDLDESDVSFQIMKKEMKKSHSRSPNRIGRWKKEINRTFPVLENK